MLLLYLRFPYHQYLRLPSLFSQHYDALDGRPRAQRGQVTDFGKFMDPLADKLW
jgi:phosphatidylglycerophosphate synthase